jgi:hypothetical protein
VGRDQALLYDGVTVEQTNNSFINFKEKEKNQRKREREREREIKVDKK